MLLHTLLCFQLPVHRISEVRCHPIVLLFWYLRAERDLNIFLLVSVSVTLFHVCGYRKQQQQTVNTMLEKCTLAAITVWLNLCNKELFKHDWYDFTFKATVCFQLFQQTFKKVSNGNLASASQLSVFTPFSIVVRTLFTLEPVWGKI